MIDQKVRKIQPFENVKIYKEMYGNPDAVRHGVRIDRHEIYIFGDDVDFLKYNDHSQTEEFLDMLFANN